MGDSQEVDFLHKMASSMASADPLQEVLTHIVDFAASVVSCDSCFLYALEDGELILRASKNAHPDVVDRLKLRLGQGITGWVAEHGQAGRRCAQCVAGSSLSIIQGLAGRQV